MEKIDKIGFETKQDLKKLNNMIIEDVIRTFIFQILFLIICVFFIFQLEIYAYISYNLKSLVVNHLHSIIIIIYIVGSISLLSKIFPKNKNKIKELIEEIESIEQMTFKEIKKQLKEEKY